VRPIWVAPIGRTCEPLMDVSVLPFWPRDRYIELAPRYWRITRARLDPEELELEIGWLTIPEPPLPTP